MRARCLLVFLTLGAGLAGCFDFQALGSRGRGDAAPLEDAAVADGLGLDLSAGDAGAVTGVTYVQGVANAKLSTELYLPLPNVKQGDLLVGWFLQYDAEGQVVVGDNLNGFWTRGPSLVNPSTSGDVALYYTISTHAGSLIVAAKATTQTQIQATVSEYSGILGLKPLDQALVGADMTQDAKAGPTPTLSVPGELVYIAHTNGTPAGAGTIKAADTFTLRVTDGRSSAADRVVTDTDGATGSFTFETSTDWNMVVATFKPALPL